VARLCIFCGSPADEQEHAIPVWVPRYLNQAGAILDHTVAKNVTRRKESVFSDYKARIICKPCNRHFGKLEEQVRPLLIPLLDGIPTSFGQQDQELLARWAFKTTCALLGVERKRRAVPQRQRYALRQRGEIPASTFIGVGRYEGAGARIRAGRVRFTRSRDTDIDKDLSVYQSIIALGHVFFEVFGLVKSPPKYTFRVPVGVLYHIWPPRHDTIAWPPLWSLDDDGLAELGVFNPFVRG
jgi:hypothetical protein